MASPVLRKLYDDSFESCKKAVRCESEGDEEQAMTFWRTALSQLATTHEYADRPPQGNTNDDQMLEALREIQYQCRERIDVLEAMRLSRQDLSPQNPVNEAIHHHHPLPSLPIEAFISNNQDSSSTSQPLHSLHDSQSGDYCLSGHRQLIPPQLPPRPEVPPRAVSDQQMFTSTASSDGVPVAGSSSPQSDPSAQPTKNESPSRGQSPEKYTMRTTLRTGKTEKPPKRPNILSRPNASRAATLAWASLLKKDHKKPDQDTSAATAITAATTTPVVPRGVDSLPRPSPPLHWDSHSRRLVTPRASMDKASRRLSEDAARQAIGSSNSSGFAAGASSSAMNSSVSLAETAATKASESRPRQRPPVSNATSSSRFIRPSLVTRVTDPEKRPARRNSDIRRKPVATAVPDGGEASKRSQSRVVREPSPPASTRSSSDNSQAPTKMSLLTKKKKKRVVSESRAQVRTSSPSGVSSDDESDVSLTEKDMKRLAWEKRKAEIMRSLPEGVDEGAAAQILTEIVVQGDEVHWHDVAGLEVAKAALREAVVYPFLRPDLFMGLREPARGILLFGPPGTGKTMLARAVATESKSTFFAISASSLTSKYLGESEKLVRALFGLAKTLAPSIIFVDEIDSLMGQRSGSGEHEATRRIKTEFLIQWSALQRAAVGRESDKETGDPNRVLVLAATNLPWAIDEAARRRFVRRQYIPLPDQDTRRGHLANLLGHQNQNLSENETSELVQLTDGFSGSDLTALAKDAAMGPLRSLGEAVLTMSRDDIPPISFADFKTSLTTIRPSVSKSGLKQHEDWAREFGERGG